MDSLGNIPPVVIKPAVPASVPSPVPQKKPVPTVPVGGGSGFDPIAAEQERFQAVRRVAQKLADNFVVSDRTFTIFKDISGQYITRFTSLRDGKVTYIPEPNLFRLGGESDRVSVKVEA
ncbi:MAG: hypothetical protein R3D71_03275 [Rickettsiales bacterium]